MSALEFIECLANEAFSLLKTEVVDMKKLESLIRSGLEASHTIRSVTNFMLSTVNRCLDYTKVSKGLELVPRNETFDLIESLQLPIDCVNGLESATSVKMESMSVNICRYVISDKQVRQSPTPRAY